MEVGYIADGTHTGYAQLELVSGDTHAELLDGPQDEGKSIASRPRRSGARNADIWNRTQSRKRIPKDNQLRDSFPGYWWPKNAEDRGVQLETVCLLNKPDFLKRRRRTLTR
jgi:hypothetical protein